MWYISYHFTITVRNVKGKATHSSDVELLQCQLLSSNRLTDILWCHWWSCSMSALKIWRTYILIIIGCEFVCPVCVDFSLFLCLLLHGPPVPSMCSWIFLQTNILLQETSVRISVISAVSHPGHRLSVGPYSAGASTADRPLLGNWLPVAAHLPSAEPWGRLLLAAFGVPMGRLDGNDPVLQRPPSPLKLFFRKMPASFAKKIRDFWRRRYPNDDGSCMEKPRRLGIGQLRNGNFAQVLSGKGIMVPKHTPPGAIGWVWRIWTNQFGAVVGSGQTNAKQAKQPIGESIQSLNWPGSIGKCWEKHGKTICWWMIYSEKHGTTSGFHSIPARIRFFKHSQLGTSAPWAPLTLLGRQLLLCTGLPFFFGVEMGMDQTWISSSSWCSLHPLTKTLVQNVHYY